MIIQKKPQKNFWAALETAAAGSTLNRDEVIAALRFNDQGLLPVVVQCYTSRCVLMVAWMNHAALEQTLASGYMTYYSRSRGALWKKGETSGHYQKVVTLTADCDGDTLLAEVHQTGNACHTNRFSCFYARLDPDSVVAPAASE